jgi:hypothetical protein
VTLLDKAQQTGEMTGEVVKAMEGGAQNQSWEDVGRTARFLSQLDCIDQTVGVYGQGLTAMPFTQPAMLPTPPAYYVGVPEGKDLAVLVDPFLGAGSTLAVFKDAMPAGGAADLNGKLERAASTDKMRLVSKVLADGPKAAVAWTEDIGLPKLGVYAVATDLLGKEDAALSKTLRDGLAGLSYAGMLASDKDPAADYRLWVSAEDEDTTRPFARARSGEFPEDDVQGKPAGRAFSDSVAWERGILHYLRAVQGAAWARNRACGFRVWATPDQARPLYLPGTSVKMKLDASAACYVVLVVADSMGNVTVTPAQAVSPGKSAEVAFTPPAGGAAHDMRLVIVKALAFAKKPSDAAVAKMASEGKADPAKAMLGLLSDALGASGAGGVASVPTEGWADNEAFVAVWDRTPLTGDEGL